MNLFELFVKISVDDQASGNLKDLNGKLGNGLKTAAKIGTAAVGAAAAGITALTKAAIDNYAEYEQLIGGVETLFKDSTGKVQEYAANAYKTAGMSANEYMSTVTSFSASLLQSLGGDTDKAAEYANQALTDMSDNANKMGTSMEMIQNAYQGFAKQNYTMLDNLKLGYGGTKTEMERLIADAAKLDSSIKANDLSFGNIVKAINVVQTEMGITGTTAREAASTIQGSVSMMKSAWANLVTGIADENANFPQLVENFVDSSITAAENIIPRVEVALAGAGQMVERVVPIIIEKVPVIIEKYLPKILLSGISIVLQIVAGLINAIPDLVKAIPNLVKALIDGFIANKESFLGIGKNIVEGIWNGISQMAAWLKEKISGFLGGIVNNVKGVLGIHSPSKVFAGIGQFMAEGLAEGWDSEYNDVKKSIGESLDFGVKKVGVVSNVSGNGGTFGQNMTIVVQSVLDGKIIGETAYKYGQNRNRAFGGAY